MVAVNSLKINPKTGRPITLPVAYCGIPAELRQLDQWVLWRWERRQDGEWTKVPYRTTLGLVKASSTDPSTWSSFNIARTSLDTLHAGELDGLGLCLRPGEIVGTDLDKCRSADGAVEDWAREMVDTLDSYTEVSPSGRGLRVLLRGVKPGPLCRKGQVEIYDSGRYLTITGQVFRASPIQERTEKLAEVYSRVFGQEQETKQEKTAATCNLADDDVLLKCRELANGDKFAALWGGAWEGKYRSQSEADQALCNLLAYVIGPDTEKIDELFRRSGLYRQKWERASYREPTLARAIKREDWHPDLTGVSSERVKEVMRQAKEQRQENGQEQPEEQLFWTWTQYKEEAAKEKQEYIVDGLLESGGLNFFSGLSYSGKTVLEMFMVGAIITGDEFLGHYCKQVPVVYLNHDASRITRIIRHLTREREPEVFDKAAERYWYPVRHQYLFDKLTPEFVEKAVKQIERRYTATYGEEFPQPLLIVDTFRSALMVGQETGAEIDSANMLNLIRPWHQYVRTTGRTIHFLYHNARGTDDYAGAGSVPNLTDSMWLYRRDREAHNPDNARILTVQTRDAHHKFHITYDPALERFASGGTSDVRQAIFSRLLGLFGSGNTLDRVHAAYNADKPEDKRLTRATLNNYIKSLERGKPGNRLVQAGKDGRAFLYARG